MRNKPDSLSRLQAAGINYEDACALRRIAMTLHRWHELECGDGNEHASWCVTRGRKSTPFDKAIGKRTVIFEHDENGKPFLERHYHSQVAPAFALPASDRTTYEPIPDRERGALKRLAAIMARYPGFAHYVQGDPRGCSLYIMRPEDLNGSPGMSDPAFREWLSSNYSRGIGVHK